VGAVRRERVVRADHRREARRSLRHHRRQFLRPSLRYERLCSCAGVEYRSHRVVEADDARRHLDLGMQSERQLPRPRFRLWIVGAAGEARQPSRRAAGGSEIWCSYALDPDKRGEILWQVRVAQGGINGGVQFGMASDGQRVYAATSDLARFAAGKDRLDPSPAPLDPTQGGGLTALRIGTGEKAWHVPPVACGPRPGCSPAQAAAVTAIPGVVFSGSMDGHLRAYSSEEGKILWDFDTIREYSTVNGVRAKGGALNGPGAVVVGGMLFVNSGYGRNGGLAGNVLLAFEPE